jgi:hypothetical protein
MARAEPARFPPRLVPTNFPLDSLQLRQHNPLVTGICPCGRRSWLVSQASSDWKNRIWQGPLWAQMRAGKRCRVGDFERDQALPLRLKGGDGHVDAAAGIAALAHANRQNIAGNLEVFHRAG